MTTSPAAYGICSPRGEEDRGDHDLLHARSSFLPDSAHRSKTSTSTVDLRSIPLIQDTTCIDLDITDGCNLACRYCFKNLNRTNNMSFETATGAIDWLFLAGMVSNHLAVNFMGGEPLLRFPLIHRVVDWGNRRAKSLGKRISWSLTTNTTMFTEEIRRWVDEKNIGVLMSVDGLPEVQDTQRPAKDGKPKADVVAHWARSMLRTRPRSDARMTISPYCVHRLFDSCVYLWEEIGFSSIVLADCSYDQWTEYHLQKYDDEMAKVVTYLTEDFAQSGKKSIAILSYLIKDLILKQDLGQPVETRRFPCGAGYNYSMIDHKGTIWPCHRFDGAAEDNQTALEFTLGTIFTGSYNNILSNTFRHFDHSQHRKALCDSCPIDPMCAGFCPAANLSDTGNMYTPHDIYCSLKLIAFRHAEELYHCTKEVDAQRCVDFFNRVRAPREAS